MKLDKDKCICYQNKKYFKIKIPYVFYGRANKIMGKCRLFLFENQFSLIIKIGNIQICGIYGHDVTVNGHINTNLVT